MHMVWHTLHTVTAGHSKDFLSPFLSILTAFLAFFQQEKNKDKDKRFRPLYDIPYMFEAREFLRKKLIGKKVKSHNRDETTFINLANVPV